MDQPQLHTSSFESVLARSAKLRAEVAAKPSEFRVLTGDRPTGALHLGHYFGSLKSRCELLDKGVDTFLVIADYQALTDRDSSKEIRENVHQIILDYLAVGLDPRERPVTIFTHSHVVGLNHLMLPLLSLLTVAELERNPTVKDEIQKLGGRAVSSLMYTYPVHQAADILFCDGQLVPGGKDQLPHVEVARLLARRFNHKYATEKSPVFVEPELYPGEVALLLGVDGRKMGKSDNNAISIRDSEDATAALLKRAKTDSERKISFDPLNRPEVSNLVQLGALCAGLEPATFAENIGDRGAGALKSEVTEAVNSYFAPIRKRRAELEKDEATVWKVLAEGNAKANDLASEKMRRVHEAINFNYRA